MHWTEKRKLGVLMIFHLAWGLVLGWSIATYGLGVSTDATIYMFAAGNWLEGRGLVSFDGSPYWNWPPLYPLLLAFVRAPTGLEIFAAAHVVQFAAFLLYSGFASLLFLRVFRGNFFLAALASLTLDIGPVVISAFHMVQSDYVYAAFLPVLAVLIGVYAQTQKWTTAALIALTATLAALQRHIGVVDLLIAGLALLLLTHGGLRKRIGRALWVVGFSSAPLLWLLRSRAITAGRLRDPLTFDEYFTQFTRGILGWFVDEAAVEMKYDALAPIPWLIIAVLIVLLASLARRRGALNELTVPTLAYGLIYTLAIFGIALQAYFNRLWGRFQLPIYLPLVLLFYLVLDAGLGTLRERASATGYALAGPAALILILALNLPLARTAARLLSEARQGIIAENAYNTPAWHENSVIRYWKAHPPPNDYLVFANYPAGVAFHTGREAYGSPRKYSSQYTQEVIPLGTYERLFFATGKDVYLIWIEPNTYEHVYLVEELSPIARIKTIFENKDGGIYRLKPK